MSLFTGSCPFKPCVSFAHLFIDNVASRQFEGVQKMSFMKQWSKWWKCLVSQPKRIPFERKHNNISGFPYSRICLSLHLSTLLLKGCSGGKPSCIYNFSKICVLDQLPSQITLMWISVKFTPLFSFAVWETLLNTWEGSNIFVALLYKLLKIE